LHSLRPRWSTQEDVNNSDLDLVEFENADPKLGPLDACDWVRVVHWVLFHAFVAAIP
jgi:hypothetical protein